MAPHKPHPRASGRVRVGDGDGDRGEFMYLVRDGAGTEEGFKRGTDRKLGCSAEALQAGT